VHDGAEPLLHLGVGQPRRDPGRALDDLDDRPERDPLAVGEAAAEEDGGLVVDRVGELGDETRLPDAGRPQQREQVAGPVDGCALERLAEQGELALAADERRLRPARGRGRARDHGDQPPGGDRVFLALELQLGHRLDHDRVADEAVRRVADQRLACRGRAFEPGGDVDGVARHERVAGGRVAGDDLAGVEPDPDRDLDAPVAHELTVQRAECLPHLDGRADGSERVVLVHRRRAEDGHHGVADELLDRSPVALEDAAHLVEVARVDPPHRLGIDALAEHRRVGHVAEEHRDGLSGLAARRLRRQRRPAGQAEARPLGVVLAAAGAAGHVPSVGR
jgi:hypothetical protein